MAATIKDVASRAGVALGTVSRVINGFPDVSPSLRQRVEKAIRELNYRPNARAQSFVRDSSPILCYILSNRSFLLPIHSQIFHGVGEYCEEAGYFSLFTKFQYSPDVRPSQLRLPRVLQSHGIADCFILAGANYDNFLEAIEDLGVPYVVLANTLISKKARSAADQVRFDDFQGAYEATEYLIHLGHRHIWYMGDIALPWYKTRHDAYRQAMEENGLEPLTLTAAFSDDAFTNGQAAVEMLLEKVEPATAIFAGKDQMAYGVLEGLRQHGLEVPKDISLIGFGGQFEESNLPHLTTVYVDGEEVGWQLAKMAVQKIKAADKKLPEVVVPTRLVRRGTCRPPGARQAAVRTPASRARHGAVVRAAR